jgi:hypothetical protein
MKKLRDIIRERIIDWIPFAFAVYLCYSTLDHASRDLKWWEPAFYSFLPMCFFFVGFVLYVTRGEVRELRRTVAELRAAAGPK